MITPEVFFWGFLGSAAVDVVEAAQYLNLPVIKFPPKYRRVAFYILRLLLAMVAGSLAVAYQIDKEILAFNIGAAAPLIVHAFTQGFGGK